MGDISKEIEEERRLRAAAVTRAMGPSPEDEPEPDDAAEAEEPDKDEAAAHRIEQQGLWVDLQVRKAMERGDFDDLPGAGKPIRGLGATHDPDWWVKGLIEREKLTGVLPPALALRREDAELDAALDRETTEQGVRRTVEEFNRRVVEARRQLQGGPPVVTPTRDPEAEVAAWQARVEERRRRQRELLAGRRAERQQTRWWRKLLRGARNPGSTDHG
jgi:hypothetical protein